MTNGSRVLWDWLKPGIACTIAKNGCTPSATSSASAPTAATAIRSRLGFWITAAAASRSGSAPA